MSQESEQAQEASLLAGLTWGNHALQLHRRATSNAIAYTDGIRDYKAALKAEIEKELIEDEKAYSELSQEALKAIVKRGILEKKRFLSLLDTVKPKI